MAKSEVVLTESEIPIFVESLKDIRNINLNIKGRPIPLSEYISTSLYLYLFNKDMKNKIITQSREKYLKNNQK